MTESNQSTENNKAPEATPAAKKTAQKLPSKPIVFGNQHPGAKNGKGAKVGESKSKKGSNKLMRKTFGM